MNGTDTTIYPPNQVLIEKAFEKGQFEKANIADYDVPSYDEETFRFRFYTFNYSDHTIDDLILPLAGVPDIRCDILRKHKWLTAWEAYLYPRAEITKKDPLSLGQISRDNAESVVGYYRRLIPQITCDQFQNAAGYRCDYEQLSVFVEQGSQIGTTQILIEGDVAGVPSPTLPQADTVPN
jgi:hypothetical protein